jgi:hypothetical protein
MATPRPFTIVGSSMGFSALRADPTSFRNPTILTGLLLSKARLKICLRVVGLQPLLSDSRHSATEEV